MGAWGTRNPLYPFRNAGRAPQSEGGLAQPNLMKQNESNSSYLAVGNAMATRGLPVYQKLKMPLLKA